MGLLPQLTLRLSLRRGTDARSTRDVHNLGNLALVFFRCSRGVVRIIVRMSMALPIFDDLTCSLDAPLVLGVYGANELLEPIN